MFCFVYLCNSYSCFFLQVCHSDNFSWSSWCYSLIFHYILHSTLGLMIPLGRMEHICLLFLFTIFLVHADVEFPKDQRTDHHEFPPKVPRRKDKLIPVGHLRPFGKTYLKLNSGVLNGIFHQETDLLVTSCTYVWHKLGCTHYYRIYYITIHHR